MTVRQLRSDVYLPPFPGGFAERYAAGTPFEALPAAVAERISNPAAWVDVDAAPVVEVSGSSVEAVESAAADSGVFDPSNPDDLDDDADLDDEPVDPIEPVVTGVGVGHSDEPVEPPRTGRAATDVAWRQYAAALGQVVPVDARRAEVIAQLTAVGLIESEG